jgi:hypothetical protein
MSEEKVRPGGYWYIIGAAVLVLSAGVFVWCTEAFAQGIEQSMGDPFTVPGQKGLTIGSPGTYNILFDESDDGGRAGAGKLQVKVVRKDNGEEIPVHRILRKITCSFGGRHGRVLWDFPADKPGVYVISGSFPQGVADTATLSVGPEMGAKTPLFALGLLGLVVGVLGSLAIFIATPILRGRCKRRLADAADAPPAGVPPMPPAPPPL